MKTYPLPIYVQRFFTERLAIQLCASRHTMASYRDTFRILIKYASNLLGRAPTNLKIADIDADLIGNFLVLLKPRAEMAPAAATHAFPLSDRSSRMSPLTSLNSYITVSVFSRYHPNGTRSV